MKKPALLFAAVVLAACVSNPPTPTLPPPQPTESAPGPEPAPTDAPAPAAAKTDGPFRVSLISVKTESKAEKLAKQFADKGYRVETETVEVDGATWRRVVFPGQASLSEAKELLAKLEAESGIKGGWIPAQRKGEP